MKMKDEGRSHWGLLIGAAVIAAAVFVVLVAGNYLNKGKKQECQVTREEILRDCEIKQGEAAITDSLDDAALRALQMVMMERKGVPVGTYQYRNICLGGGVLTYNREKKELYCSVHGRNGLSQEETAKKAAAEELPKLFEGGVTVIDSTEPGNAAVGRIAALQGYSWAINYRSSGQYEIFLTDAEIEILQPGSTVFVTMYNTLTEETTSGTAAVSYKIAGYQGGKVTYHVIDIESFQPIEL